MKYVVAFGLVGAIGYMIWWFMPPADALGSKLTGWETSDRRKEMIRASDDQDHTLFGGTIH